LSTLTIAILFTCPPWAAPKPVTRISQLKAAPPNFKTTKLSKKNPLVDELVNIDENCDAYLGRVQTVLSDAYDMAEVAQHMTVKDSAFTNYFLADQVNLVHRMYKSIISGGPKKTRKFNVTCPGFTENECEAEIFAVTDVSEPLMKLCPYFFTCSESKNDLSSKPFSEQGWCTPPPHSLVRILTGGHTILHEMTHLSSIGHEALSPGSMLNRFKKTVISDVYGQDDENDPSQIYWGFPPSLARSLKQRWKAYRAHGVKGLRKPPLETIKNAESYAAAATEFYFSKKCNNFVSERVYEWVLTLDQER